VSITKSHKNGRTTFLRRFEQLNKISKPPATEKRRLADNIICCNVQFSSWIGGSNKFKNRFYFCASVSRFTLMHSRLSFMIDSV